MLPFCVGDDYDMTKRLFVLFGLMICAGAVTAQPLGDGDVEAGKTRAAACAACHGPQGNMESAQFPKLAGQGAPYIHEQLKLFKSGERDNAIMAGQAAGLSDEDMANIAAFYASQQTRPGAADVAVAPAGAVIYHGGNAEDGIPACSGCHGPSGLGNAAAKYPRLSGQSPQYIATQLKAYRDGSRSGYRNAKIMAGVAEELSDDDIQSLASYVAGLAPASGDKDQEKGKGSEYGALMQNAGGPEAAAGPGAAKSPSDAKSSDDGSDPADAAAKQETDQTAGEEDAANDQPAGGDDSGKQENAADKAADTGSSNESSPDSDTDDSQNDNSDTDQNDSSDTE